MSIIAFDPLSLLSPAATPVAATVTGPNYAIELLKTLVIFLLVIGVLYTVAFLVIRRFKPALPASGSAGIEIVGARPLEPGRTIYLLRFRGREWLVACGPQSCETIAEVTPEPFRSHLPVPSTDKPPQPPVVGERV